MIVFSRTTTDESHTAALASGLADILAPTDVILLEGEMGAGKTTFTRALAESLGITQGVSSPTFVIVNVYPVPARKDALARLVHIDAYRVTSDEDLEPLGWDQLFDPHTRLAAPDAAALIEWPGNIAHALPARDACIHIQIRPVGQTSRQFTFTLPPAFRSRPRAEWLIERPPIRCPKTKRWTSPTALTYPFFDKRAQDADLYGWLTDSYAVPPPPASDSPPTDSTN
jgi:tRNA threonylcarbamoyladenosine biosynthesis protein TsaE